MKRQPFGFIIALVFAFFCLNATAANNTPAPPDFAFPKKVSQQSEQKLKKALRAGDDIEALRALTDFALAQGSISEQNLPKALGMFSYTASKLRSKAATSVLCLLKATVYNEIYSDNKWVYDQRSLPLSPLPADYTEWSGAQFRKVISQLCDSAMAAAPDLQRVPIGDYSTLIVADAQTAVYFPTLFDFAACKTIELRRNLSEFSNCLSILLLTPLKTFIGTPVYSPSAPEAAKILETYAQILRFHENDTAPLIYNDLARLQFTCSNLYSSMSEKGTERYHQLLVDLYNKYSSSQYSGDILLALSDDSYTISVVPYDDVSQQNQDTGWDKKYYNMLRDFTARHPSYPRIACIRNIMSGITGPTLSVSSASTIIPGDTLSVTISGRNINDVSLKLYRLPASSKAPENYFDKADLAKATHVRTYDIPLQGEAPFAFNTKISMPIPSQGVYVIVPDFKGADPDYIRNLHTLLSTDIILGRISDTGNSLFVVNAFDGAPVNNARIYRVVTKRGASDTLLGSTGKDGFYQIPDTKSSYSNIYARSASNCVTPTVDIWKQSATEKKWTSYAAAFTDLAIYRPADTVRWNAIVYQTCGEQRRVCENHKVRVVLRNANNLSVDTINAVTDSFGRVDGSFAIPTGELTGTYNIFIYDNTDSKSLYLGSRDFMVSDYKMPTFFVEITKTAKSTPSQGDVTITGRARTYSGMAMADIPLQINLSARQYGWWRASNDIQFYSVADTTDASGSFSLVIPKAVFDNSPAPDGIFTALVQATSVAGESRQTSTSFTLGNPLSLYVSMPDIINAAEPFKLNLRVTDAFDKPADTDVVCRISSDGKTVMQQTMKSSAPKLDLSSLKSGQYSFTFTMPAQPADSTVLTSVIYRPTDKMPPVKSVIWAPSHSLTTQANRTATLRYGNSAPTHVLYILSSDDNVIERRWIKSDAGMHNLDIKIPDNVSSAVATLSAVSNNASKVIRVNIEVPVRKPAVKIIAESFRDRVIPGTEERWTFRTVDQDSTGVASAMILDMYNGALDALVRPDWHLYINSINYHRTLNLNFASIYAVDTYVSGKTVFENCPQFNTPEFQFYGLSFRPMRFYSKRYSTRSLGAVMLKEESVAMAAVPMAVSDAEVSMNQSLDMDEVAESVTDDAVDMTNNAGSDGGNSAKTDDSAFTYRNNADAVIAFYRPTLTTGSDGRLSFSYRVPDANTTWRFNALAYTRGLLTDLYSADVLANKPVMVQPNLPRFLRTGDVAEIRASVMNNTEASLSVATKIEIFNPADNSVIDSRDTVMTIDAGASAPVAIRVEAPVIPMLGYRIKSSSEQFADGEQSLIPVLPNATPVIETQPFYISPDSTKYEMTIARQGADARVTLQFCNNPAWYVVTALPGLRSDKLTTPQDAADAIFSAAVAEGILRDYPAVRDALRHWAESDRSDSTLTSMLSRNADLKTVLLQATPWMMDAASDTERMQRLALLFDKSEISAVYERSTALLRKLSRPCGGWAWVEWSDEASLWATYSTLMTLGRLNATGYLPANKELMQMIKAALRWHEDETVKTYRKYPSVSQMAYAQLRDLWPSISPSATGQQIIAREVQRVVKDWKKLSVAGKAEAITMLHKHGYQSLARTVMQSLMEFSEQSPEKGLWWPSVDDIYGGSMQQLLIASDALSAIRTVDPSSPDIDRIRQWLILQKEARNWGSTSVATQIIATFLSSSHTWIAPSQPVEITVGRHRVDTTPADNRLGYFRTDISSLNPSGAILSVVKGDKTPAWGAVYSQSRQVITDIKASSCDAVSIEKRMFRQNGTEWQAVDSDLRVGDRVKIQLLIHATRDMQYLAITDDRAACLEPVEQLPAPIWSEGLCFYRENRDSSTNMFVTNMPAGTYLLEYELWVNNAGTFSSGIATIQSQYAPQLTAHSAGSTITITE